jgi:hypothetical protein
MIGPITLGVKRAGEPDAGNLHVRFDRAGAGDGLTVAANRARSWKRRTQPSCHLRGTAPALDPTSTDLVESVASSNRRDRRSTVLIGLPSPALDKPLIGFIGSAP